MRNQKHTTQPNQAKPPTEKKAKHIKLLYVCVIHSNIGLTRHKELNPNNNMTCTEERMTIKQFLTTAALLKLAK